MGGSLWAMGPCGPLSWFNILVIYQMFFFVFGRLLFELFTFLLVKAKKMGDRSEVIARFAGDFYSNWGLLGIIDLFRGFLSKS